ncbi:hypothetical protein E2C01_032124 [Portunus trituberculatus]|uniref:CD80-like immunoglobulin C2-set domain-containing protein n=1 Tax=Portunus trituberculatus TaxID=210409 RepID=A0A5B7F0J1_PORTR|nr:hypothetical protein [Portunus trituberculatus]
MFVLGLKISNNNNNNNNRTSFPPDLPDHVPTITGGRPKYRVGDEVHVNCTSLRSRPAASLMWYINDKQVSFRFLSILSLLGSSLVTFSKRENMVLIFWFLD